MPNSMSSAWGRIGAHTKWAMTEDRSAATAPARAALEQKFLDEAGGDPRRAQSLRKAYYARLALKSAQARRARGSAPPGEQPARKTAGTTSAEPQPPGKWSGGAESDRIPSPEAHTLNSGDAA